MSTLFATLPESDPTRRPRSRGDVALSVAVHAALVALAVVATAREGKTTPPPRETVLPLISPPEPARPRTHAQRSGSTGGDPRPVPPSSPPFPVPPTVIFDPPTDGPATTPSTGPIMDFGPERSTGPGSPGTGEGSGAADGSPLDAPRVEVEAAMLPGAHPRYPASLRDARVEGRVTLRFVVDTTGRVEPASVRVLSSTNALFTAAVRAALPSLRFTPASAGGRRVRQLVELPFEFALER